MPSVSHSEVESYLLCRRKQYYGYTLSLKRIRTSDSLAMGSAGHAVLEAFYKTILAAGNSPEEQLAAFNTALAAALAKLEELVAEGYQQADNRADLGNTLANYFENETLVKSGWTILAVEKQFSLEYDPARQLRYPFVVDLIARDPKGKIVVIDHKFVYDFYSYEDSQLQPQIPKYIGALRALGFTVDYGAYNMLRTRKITGPKMKKAELVEALQTQTIRVPEAFDAAAYSKPVEKWTVAMLEAMAEHLGIETSTGPTLDQQLGWLDVRPNNTRVKRTFMEQIDTAEEIQAIKALSEEEQDRRAFRTANKMVCQSCSFKDICRTEMVGGNTKIVIATEYSIRTRTEMEVTPDGLDDDTD